jgi:hypothetical protein
MALTKSDEKKIGTYGFHEPAPADQFEPESFGVISIYRIEANKAGDDLRNRSSGIQLRFKRFTTDAAIKQARKIVKQLNAGEDLLQGRDRLVVCVPTGRPRGRRPQN